ncbi:unnamed protein product, partial [Hymenolepis diminuta]|uniref:Ovule protein n=1 Tax=Hymenolepis diminuta TaxID=6216 RepID=A0A0R3SNL2_HYMDI
LHGIQQLYVAPKSLNYEWDKISQLGCWCGGGGGGGGGGGDSMRVTLPLQPHLLLSSFAILRGF